MTTRPISQGARNPWIAGSRAIFVRSGLTAMLCLAGGVPLVFAVAFALSRLPWHTDLFENPILGLGSFVIVSAGGGWLWAAHWGGSRPNRALARSLGRWRLVSRSSLSNSFVSLGRVVGPLWAGAVFDLNPDFPYLSGVVILFIVFLLSLLWLGADKMHVAPAASK